MNFSLAGTNATADNLDYTTTKVSYEYQIMSDYAQISMFPFIFILCCVGVTLNGIVIWLLGFQIKRNPFTVLILNLAIADFGFLISMAIFCIEIFIHFIPPGIPFQVLFSLFNFTYINGLFLLTAISIDRCVVAIWNLHLVVTAVICLPLITISTIILFINICLQSKQMKHGRLLVMILISLLCFLILTLPLYIYVFITHFLKKKNLFDVNELDYYLSPSASLNSSINPVIYFLVGRKKCAWSRESIKVMFQGVFRDNEAPEI
uniref:G-protein coupled receptors family 1 profile domain-containing protein n=1 Tax=Naja naja TaxID=35670 RepID=A0A8C6YHI5_NAJNA